MCIADGLSRLPTRWMTTSTAEDDPGPLCALAHGPEDGITWTAAQRKVNSQSERRPWARCCKENTGAESLLSMHLQVKQDTIRFFPNFEIRFPRNDHI